MEVIEVTTEKEFRKFLELPRKIYKNDPNWTAPFEFQMREKLNPKRNPFLEHGWIKMFLAVDGGETVGRIVASDDPRFNDENKSNIGMFGFFEAIDEQNVANALFDKAARVLKEERKRDLLFGPVEFSTNYECALLVDGFDAPAKVMMPYNARYYPRLFETWGFQKNRDLFSWWFDETAIFAEQWRPIVERLQKRYGFEARPISLKNFDADVARCLEVYDAGRSEWWWARVSLTPEEVRSYAEKLRKIARPEQALLAEIDGKLVGFSITVSDFNEAARPLGGKLSWFGVPYLGALRLKYRMKRVKGARMMVLCVLPEYRRMGVAERLILDTFDYGRNVLKYENAELGWTDENNDKINHVLERVGAKRCKRYRVYQKDI